MADRRAAVLGHPIAHSLSPVLHRAAYAALGLDGWRYDAVDVTEDGLAAFVGSLDASWAGLSLTMPLKQAILPLLDHVEPQAEVLGVVNTVLVHGQGAGRQLTGANTDVHGIVAALAEAGVMASGSDGHPVRRAVVLGAGATAASALAALGSLGCTNPLVLARSMARAGSTMRAAHRMGLDAEFRVLDERSVVEVLHEAEVVLSTLPPRAADGIADALRASASGEVGPGAGVGAARPVHGVVLDCAYDPRPTALVAAWQEAGGVAVTGERMLLHQAGEQVRLMTGARPPVEAMAAALAEALV